MSTRPEPMLASELPIQTDVPSMNKPAFLPFSKGLENKPDGLLKTHVGKSVWNILETTVLI